MGSIIDYDEIDCPCCGHIGVLPDGDLDVICPECGYEFSLMDDEEDEWDSSNTLYDNEEGMRLC